MRRLSALLQPEDGASAVLVAVMMLMLLGFAAFAVDVGALYQERRELQNGADAAALAAAQDCANRAMGGSACTTHTDAEINATADTYANENANDGVSSAEILPEGDPDGITDWAGGRLTVRTTTISNGNGFLTHWFAWAIGHPTSTVRAKASAAWGGIGGATTLPITISQCEWERFTADGYATEPFDPATQEIIHFHDGNATEPCHSSSSGQDIPGGFGWLDTDSGCYAALTDDDWAGEDPGSSASNGCDSTTIRNLLGTTILIPIFDAVNGLNGTNGEYHIYGFAAFHITSYRLGGSPEWNGVLPGYAACGSGDVRCVGGHFTTFVDIGAELDPTAPSLGGMTVQLVG